MRNMIKDSKVYSDISKLRRFFAMTDIKLTDFFLPLLLTFLAAFFEALNASFLIPLASGLLTGKFNLNINIPVIKDIIAAVLSHYSSFKSTLVALVIFTLLTTVIRLFFQHAGVLILYRRILEFSYKIKNLIFKRYLHFGKLFFDKSSQGYLSEILSSYVDILANQLVALVDFLHNAIMLILFLTIMVIISWQMTIFVMVVFLLQNYFSKKVSQKLRQISMNNADAQRELSTQIFNILSCIPLVKAYNKEDEEEKRFAVMTRRSADLRFSMDSKTRVIGPFNEISMQITLMMLLLATVFVVHKEGTANLAVFLVYFYIVKKCANIFSSLMGFKACIATISGTSWYVKEMLSDRDKVFIAGGNKEFPGLKTSVDFNHLNFSYNVGTPVLKDLTFSIRQGEMTALVGPTGAGKTTIASLILRFYEYPPASILLDGTDIRDFTLGSLRSHIAFVSQDTLLFNDTIKNNIAYGVDKNMNDAEIIDVVKKAQLYDFIMKLPKGLETYIGDRGIRLSGGEKQRVSIARALLRNSQVLILDEATSALDTNTEKIIQRAIEELVKDRTTIVIAHRLSTIRNANKIIVIEQGRLIEEGSLIELLEKKGKFYEYWEAQKFY